MSEPLITKYRPKGLDTVVGHGGCLSRLRELVKLHHEGTYSLPHLLFTGPPGIGKTTIAKALCQDLYGPSWRGYVLEMNASDERGIDVVRGRIKKFASSVATGTGFNIIILDEADNLTPDAQAALRMTMEEYSRNCRFILCANYSNRIIDPIKDRCAYYRFKPLDDGQVASVILKVAGSEGYNLRGLENRIAVAAKGSLRRALNLLAQLPKTPSAEDIEDIVPTLNSSTVYQSLKFAFAGNWMQAEREIMQLVWAGHDASEILMELAEQIINSQLNTTTKLTITSAIAEAEYRILFGCNPGIQLRSLICNLTLLTTK